MATIHHDDAADLSLIPGKKIAIIGYGSPGDAHALNLRDSGCTVCIGLHDQSKSRQKAISSGLTVKSNRDAAAWADVIMLLAPDTTQPAIYEKEIAPNLSAGKMLMFAHGFNIRYGTIHPPANVDVTMIAPKAPGHRVREVFAEGGGTPCLLAVHQDATRKGKALALSYGKAIGGTRAGIIETTFTEETETDLFGEQAVLCGGVSELIKAGFSTLVEAGYQPEAAYFECLHEMKLIVDLMYEGGISKMYWSVSDTAEFGGYTRGPRLINDSSRQEMRKILGEIQDGTFTRGLGEEMDAGKPNLLKRREGEQNEQIEQVGAKLRPLMSWLSEDE